MCTTLLGLWWAMRKRELERVAYVAAYIAGSEVLWRMTGGEVVWEFGKYATAAVLVIALLRLGRLNGSTGVFLYFFLLLPSACETIVNLDPGLARRQLSFNLSGPLALMMSVWFFSNLSLSKAQLNRVFLAFMGPVAGVAGVTLFGTLTAAYIQFTTNSNRVTSAGFGPNQVSAVLGLAAFLAFFYVLHDKTTPALKAVLIPSVIVFATQSAMTFSRGGLYAAAGAAMLAGLFLIREKRGTARLLQIAPVLFVLAVYVVVPQVVSFTGGAISERFKKTSLTRRGRSDRGRLKHLAGQPDFRRGPGYGRRPSRPLWRTHGIPHRVLPPPLGTRPIRGSSTAHPPRYRGADIFACERRRQKGPDCVARSLELSVHVHQRDAARRAFLHVRPRVRDSPQGEARDS